MDIGVHRVNRVTHARAPRPSDKYIWSKSRQRGHQRSSVTSTQQQQLTKREI